MGHPRPPAAKALSIRSPRVTVGIALWRVLIAPRLPRWWSSVPTNRGALEKKDCRRDGASGQEARRPPIAADFPRSGGLGRVAAGDWQPDHHVSRGTLGANFSGKRYELEMPRVTVGIALWRVLIARGCQDGSDR